MDCCSSQSSADKGVISKCPDCNAMGAPVKLKTVKSLFNKSLFEISGKEYEFCSTSSCKVIYYDKSGEHKIIENDIHGRVYHKNVNDKTVILCNCFNYTLGDILNDIDVNGESEIYDKIAEGAKTGICACDIKNPEGKCCLPTIKNIIKNNIL